MTIRAKVLTAVKWTVIAKVSGQLFAWAITIFVIRILSPADYGLMAMSVVFTQLLFIVGSVGLEIALVQRSDLDDELRARIYGSVILTNWSCFIIMFFASGAIAEFFGEPQLRMLIIVLSLQFLIIAFEDLPISQLERKLDFKRRSICEMVSMLSSSIVTLALAIMGLGVWSLIVGHLVMHGVRVVGLNIVSPARVRPKLSFEGMREVFAFGGFVSLGRILWFSFAESDKLVGGKILGKEPLGYYTVANQLASLPIHKISGLISAVAFPAFSKVQSNEAEVRFYLRKAIRLMSLFAFPVFFGISSISPNIVAIFLGEKWLMASMPLQVLALVMPVRMVSTVMPPLLWGIGKPETSAMNFLIAGVIMVPAFIVGAEYGPIGLAMAWATLYPVVFIIKAYRVSNAVGLATRNILQEMARPLIAATIMLAAVALARYYIPGDDENVLQLLLLIAIGALAFVSAMAVVHPQGLKEALDLVRGAQKNDNPDVADTELADSQSG